MRFSGHDTFHCKEQWFLKGLQLVKNEGSASILRSEEAIYKLGVGKNMVRSFHYWLRSFNLLDEKDQFTSYSEYIFLTEKLDPFLENENSLWLLQYLICSSDYATIYKMIFSDFFLDKASDEFSEHQILGYINRILIDLKIKKFTENTIKSDFKVFIKTYVAPSKNVKTIEDDFSIPLISLKLVSNTKRKNSLNQSVFRIERQVRKNISESLFAFCLLDQFKEETSINFDEIQDSLGRYFCLSSEGLEEIISRMCSIHKEFVFKNDAGVKQVQIKKHDPKFPAILIRGAYESAE